MINNILIIFSVISLSFSGLSQESSNSKLEAFGQTFFEAFINEDIEAFKPLIMNKEILILNIQNYTPKDVAEKHIENINKISDNVFWDENKKRIQRLIELKNDLSLNFKYLKIDFIKDERESKSLGFDVGSAKIWMMVDGEIGVFYIYIDKITKSDNNFYSSEIGEIENTENQFFDNLESLEDTENEPVEEEAEEMEEVEEEAE